MLIATDHKGIQLVKCLSCGEIYSVCEHGCPECGSISIIVIRKDDENDRIRGSKNQRLTAR